MFARDIAMRISHLFFISNISYHIIYLCFEYNGLALLQQSRARLGSAEASSFIESMI